MSEKEPRRHIDFEHLIIVILVLLGIVFAGIAISMMTSINNPSNGGKMMSHAASSSRPSSTATASAATTQLSDKEIKTRIASVINSNLKQKYHLNYTYVSTDDITLQKEGDDEYVASGTFTSTENGQSHNHEYAYTIQCQTIDGTTQQYVVKSLKLDGKDDTSVASPTAAPVTTELKEQGRYNVTVGKALNVNAHASTGEVRVDAIDSDGNTKTIYDKQGPFNESNVEIEMPAGKYTIVMYSSASDWNWSFTAS